MKRSRNQDFRHTYPLPRVGEVAKCYYGQFSENPRKTLGLYPSRDFPSRLHRVCLVPNRPRILRESVANRWKIHSWRIIRQLTADYSPANQDQGQGEFARAGNLFSRGGF
jgi:hypothetical protein